jgi:mono/diheme cytochrome c family protein
MGHQKFVGNCAMCHEPPAANRSVFPDLRYSPMINSAEAFSAVVLDGVLQANGMASFKGRLTPDDVQSVRAYVIERANQAKVAAAALKR